MSCSWVRSISSCPEIQSGDGCVVTGTFTHLNDDVHELTFVDSNVVLQPTGLHPLWSEDRGGWVRTHDLEVGERLRSEQGPLEVATIRRLEGARQVFNLEVASDHTYLVSDSAILSHNACDPSTDLDTMAKSGSEIDPSDKGGSRTKAGRALHKHGSRKDSAFPAPKGSPTEMNRRGQEILEDILTDPDTRFTRGNRFGDNAVDAKAPDGRGARFDDNGSFQGFLEP